MPRSVPEFFSFAARRLAIGDRETSSDRQGGELADRVAAGPPIRQLLFVEALGHARLPFAGLRADHHAGIELAGNRRASMSEGRYRQHGAAELARMNAQKVARPPHLRVQREEAVG